MKKRLLFLIPLFIVSLVTFSNATFAWFTEQLHPEVGSLIFNVATQEHLMISTSGKKGEFEDELNFNELYANDKVTLKPLKGVVSDNDILLKNDNGTIANKNDYIKFPLYFSSSTDMDVYLDSRSDMIINIVKNADSIFKDEDVNKIVDSIRIGFLVYNTVKIDNGPNVDTTYTPVNTLVYSENEKTSESYKDVSIGKPYETFSSLRYTNDPDRDVVLFSTKANEVKKIDVFIWLESQDKSCDVKIFDAKLTIEMVFFGNQIVEGGASEE